MKENIHPKYENTTIKCACGNEIKTRSTVFPEIHIELCSACHPFFTGKQKFVDTAGRVDKFRARVEAAAKNKSKNQKEIAVKEKSEKTNTEKLTEIKNEITNPIEEKPVSTDSAHSAIAQGSEKSRTTSSPQVETEKPVSNEVEKPMTVDQEMTSDEEIAAAEELVEVREPSESAKENGQPESPVKETN